MPDLFLKLVVVPYLKENHEDKSRYQAAAIGVASILIVRTSDDGTSCVTSSNSNPTREQ